MQAIQITKSNYAISIGCNIIEYYSVFRDLHKLCRLRETIYHSKIATTVPGQLSRSSFMQDEVRRRHIGFLQYRNRVSARLQGSAAHRLPHDLGLPKGHVMAVDHVAHELLPAFKQNIAVAAFCGQQDLHRQRVPHLLFLMCKSAGTSIHDTTNWLSMLISTLYFQFRVAGSLMR